MDKKLFFTDQYQCTVSISEFIRFNSCIKITHKVIFFPFFSNKNINFVSHFFDKNGQMQLREKSRREYDIPESKKRF